MVSFTAGQGTSTPGCRGTGMGSDREGGDMVRRATISVVAVAAASLLSAGPAASDQVWPGAAPMNAPRGSFAVAATASPRR
jgi:hypothetical protein